MPSHAWIGWAKCSKTADDSSQEFIKESASVCARIHANADIGSLSGHKIISFLICSFSICYLHENFNTFHDFFEKAKFLYHASAVNFYPHSALISSALTV